MLLVLGLAVGIWVLGAMAKIPAQRRLWAIAGLWGAVVVLQLILPSGHALRMVTGGSVAVWLGLGVVAGLVFLYRQLLVALRAKAESKAPVPSKPAGTFKPEELDRYARHIMLREIGGPGQKRLKNAKVLVIGAGGLGSPSLMYLAASGVGTIGIVDDDTVEASNLQRQIIHTEDRIGMPKVFSAETAMRALNPFVELRPYHRRLGAEDAVALIADYDLVLDGTDNFDTRYLVNKVCVDLGKPLISAAITQWEGQISLYHPAEGGPCYECVFPVRPAPGMVPTCAEAGVVAPLPGVIGSMMAMEAVKFLTGAGESLIGRILIHDALYTETRVITAKRREDCPICGGNHG